MRKAVASLIFAACLLSLAGVNFLTWGNIRRKGISYCLQFYSKAFLGWLGVETRLHGEFPKGGNFLVVANHLSYVDVMVVAALYPGVFVTSQDIRRDFISGWVARLAGCIQVDRWGFKTLLSDIKEMSIFLDEGHNVVLFPEATTSSGNILPFKPALITTAAHGGVKVLALALRYEDISPVGYYGTMKFLPHLRRFMATRNVKVDVEVCGVLSPEGNRKAFAQKLHSLIEQRTIRY